MESHENVPNVGARGKSMKDEYGSVIREHMKRSMEHPARYLSSRMSFRERHEITWAQTVIIALIAVAATTEIIHAIIKRITP